MAYNPDNGNMYVANSIDDTLSVIDSTTNSVIDTIDAGNGPQLISYNPDNGNMYVANTGGGTVSVIDSSTNMVIDTIAVGNSPVGVAYNPDNGNMYVANAGSNTVSVIEVIIPVADAGPDQSVESGSLVQLDGTGSSDDGGPPIVEYQWTQLEGPQVDFNPDSSTPTFTAPRTNEPADIVFQLVVINEDGVESKPDTVTISVNPVDTPPILDGIIGSGNNINIQVQKNTGNNALAQEGNGNMYSDQPIFQGQSTKQGSKVVS